MKGIELNRIEKNISGELLKGIPSIVITANKVMDAKHVLKNTIEIMKKITAFSYTNNWPTDDEWKTILPNWFVESMTLKTSNDRDSDENLWHYASWIDNLRMRSWLWYSSKHDTNSITIVLEALSIPYLHDTLVYILYSQGVKMENIIVRDDVYDELKKL